MIRVLKVVFVLALLAPFASSEAGSTDTQTVQRLAESKHTLLEGIRQAEQQNGAAISAKFEVEDGKLWLSVYTAKDGRERDAEHNTLIELKAEPNTALWKPNIEVFKDKARLTRSAMHLTLLQTTHLSLAEIISKASAGQSGTPYSAIPAVKGGKPVVAVLFAMPDGKVAAVNVDL